MEKRTLNHVPAHKLSFKQPPGWEADGDPGRCQAWSRQNARQCNNPPKQNGKWCRMHYKSGIGSTGAPVGNKFALKYGLYETGLHEDEKELWPHLKTGDLQGEINFARLSLRRYCRAQKQWEIQRGYFNSDLYQSVEQALGSRVAAEFFHIDSVEVKNSQKPVMNLEGGVDMEPVKETKVIRRKKDFGKEIKALINTIARLEEVQLKLMEEAGGEDYARRLADDIRVFGESAGATMPGGGFGAPVPDQGPEPEPEPEQGKRTL